MKFYPITFLLVFASCNNNTKTADVKADEIQIAEVKGCEAKETDNYILTLLQTYDSASYKIIISDNLPSENVGYYKVNKPADPNFIKWLRLSDSGKHQAEGGDLVDVSFIKDIKTVKQFTVKQTEPFLIDENKNKWFSSALVEEWTMDSPEKAKEVFAVTKDYVANDLFFFKTGGYSCLVNNKVYIICPHAAAFNHIEKRVFKNFTKQISPNETFGF